MISFTTQIITKKVYADQASRLSLCCMILWVFAIVFPILYLVSIGNLSWPTTSYVTVVPSLTYKNYEITYKNGDYSQYYTDFSGGVSSGANSPTIVPGIVSNSQLPLIISLKDSSITSITGVLYFDTLIQGSISNQFVGIVTFHIDSNSNTNFISSSSVSYDVKVRSTGALAQNYQANSISDTPFYSYNLTMEQNILKMNSKSLGLTLENQKISKTIVTSTTNTPSITINLNILSQRLPISSSLLAQMRQFFRQWIYVFIPVSWAVVFFIRKLAQVKIYPSRLGHASAKQKIL